MVPLLPNSLFPSLHPLLETNGIALIAPRRIPGKREELFSPVGSGMFQCLGLCCHECSSRDCRGNKQPWLCFKASVAWIFGMDCGMEPRNQQTKKALGKCFFALPCSAVSSVTSSVYRGAVCRNHCNCYQNILYILLFFSW